MNVVNSIHVLSLVAGRFSPHWMKEESPVSSVHSDQNYTRYNDDENPNDQSQPILIFVFVSVDVLFFLVDETFRFFFADVGDIAFESWRNVGVGWEPCFRQPLGAFLSVPAAAADGTDSLADVIHLKLYTHSSGTVQKVWVRGGGWFVQFCSRVLNSISTYRKIPNTLLSFWWWNLRIKTGLKLIRVCEYQRTLITLSAIHPLSTWILDSSWQLSKR